MEVSIVNINFQSWLFFFLDQEAIAYLDREVTTDILGVTLGPLHITSSQGLIQAILLQTHHFHFIYYISSLGPTQYSTGEVSSNI